MFSWGFTYIILLKLEWLATILHLSSTQQRFIPNSMALWDPEKIRKHQTSFKKVNYQPHILKDISGPLFLPEITCWLNSMVILVLSHIYLMWSSISIQTSFLKISLPHTLHLWFSFCCYLVSFFYCPCPLVQITCSFTKLTINIVLSIIIDIEHNLPLDSSKRWTIFSLCTLTLCFVL